MELMLFSYYSLTKSENMKYQLTITFDSLMLNAMQEKTTVVTKCRSRISGGDPSMLDLSTITINIRFRARTFEYHIFTAFLMYVKTTIYEIKKNLLNISGFLLNQMKNSTHLHIESPACQNPCCFRSKINDN